MKLHLTKSFNRTIGLIVSATTLTGAIAFYTLSQFTTPRPEQQPTTAATKPKVTALGRIEPESKIIRLAAPVSLEGDRVTELAVKEGERVKAGQVIAILDSRDRLQDAVQQAEQEVKIAQSKLEQVQAGAKTGELRSQQSEIARLEAELAGELSTQTATIDRLEAEVNNARTTFNRYAQLHREGAISATELDSRQLTYTTAQAQLKEAQANQNRTAATLRSQITAAKADLDKLAEVRPVDVKAARMEVENAIAHLQTAETELAKAYIYAPMNGQILKVHTQPGEKVNESGIVDLAQTERMAVVAEVYQSDISKIQVGQQAEITGQGFSGALQGNVTQVGLQVHKQNVFGNQPGENLDRRIVEVKIRLNPEASQKVSGLTNLQVQTSIEL
jgi:HlyD family secretion protein